MNAQTIFRRFVLPALGSEPWHPWDAFLAAINEAQVLMCASTGLLYDRQTIIVPAGVSFVKALDVLPLFQRLRKAETPYAKLRVVSPAQLASTGILEEGPMVAVTQIGADLLLFNPAPQTATSVTLEYYRYPRIINAEHDEPEVPVPYQSHLADYTIVRMLAMDGGAELSRANARLKRFFAGVEALAKEVAARGR